MAGEPTIGSEGYYDPETGTTVLLNDTGIDDSQIIAALNDQHPEIAALTRWSGYTQTRHGTLFERDRYVTPSNIYHQMQVAYDAAENDDVVSGVLETTESLAFSKTDFESEDEDEEDIWNQIAADIDLDRRLREMWREEFTVSQFYCAIWWGRKSYKVRGKSEKGVTRKKRFDNLRVPRGLTLLDPFKVIPVGTLMFGQEQLAYIADRGEDDAINKVLDGVISDPVISQLIGSPYKPDRVERSSLAGVMPSSTGIDRLFLLNPQNVFRHTSTRSDYDRFAKVRMKSVFELLDLKHQLRAMDRAHLVGGTNFIVLVTKGSDTIPARPEEIATLQTQVRTVARVPVIVGDHRLKVEIITPDTDTTLQPERYNGIDARVTARLYQMFMTGNFAAGAKGDDSIKLARVVARGLQSRRHMLRRTIEKYVVAPTTEANDSFTSNAKMRFHPKRIDLDFDPAFANYMLDLRDRGDISRESVLDEIDFSQSDEARKRKRETERYDHIFAPVNVPVPGVPQGGPASKPMGGPADRKMDPRTGGRNGGGLRNGGGAAPGSGQGKPAVDPRRSK